MTLRMTEKQQRKRMVAEGRRGKKSFFQDWMNNPLEREGKNGGAINAAENC